MSSVSLVMIVKNEESTLERCLESVKNIVDEIVIVDTGSVDNTKEIAQRFNAKIYDFEWCNDFSAARNYALSKATGEIRLVLDADEYIIAGTKADIIAGSYAAAYNLGVWYEVSGQIEKAKVCYNMAIEWGYEKASERMKLLA